MNLARYSALDRLFSDLDDLLKDFHQDREACTFECNALRYGLLSKELDCRGLLFPRPQIPFLGLSFEDVVSSLGDIQNPKWHNESERQRYSHYCELRLYIQRIIDRIDDKLTGLSLRNFRT